MTSSVAELIARHRADGVLLDTNLLLLLFIGLTDRRLIISHKRTSQFRPLDFDLLVRFLEGFERRLVTPHILTETSNLGCQISEPGRSQFLRTLRVLVKGFQEVIEGSGVITQIEEHLFCRLGLTDSVILASARTPFLVLTDDGPLANELTAREASVIRFQDLR